MVLGCVMKSNGTERENSGGERQKVSVLFPVLKGVLNAFLPNGCPCHRQCTKWCLSHQFKGNTDHLNGLSLGRILMRSMQPALISAIWVITRVKIGLPWYNMGSTLHAYHRSWLSSQNFHMDRIPALPYSLWMPPPLRFQFEFCSLIKVTQVISNGQVNAFLINGHISSGVQGTSLGGLHPDQITSGMISRHGY